MRNNLRHPVVTLRWEDAWTICFRLGLVLPTEAQWEYACRAGTTTPWWCGSDKERLREVANLSDLYDQIHEGPRGFVYEPWDDGNAVHAPVGTYLPNGFGLHDVHGNVWEWCQDTHQASYADQIPRKGDGLRHTPGWVEFMNRGGSFFEPAGHARSAARNVGLSTLGYFNLGVRPARGIQP
jgi:formylglycine-generating enzyme required for sulfatase activity